MVAFDPVYYLVHDICRAVPSGAVGHVELVGTVLAAFARIAVSAVALLPSMVGLGTVLAVPLVDLMQQRFSPHHYAVAIALV